MSSGRVIRVHPEDAPAGRDLVRILDREVGLLDHPDIVAKGVNALKTRLAKPVAARPVRPDMSAALGQGTRPQGTRGAQATPSATPVGYGSKSINGNGRQMIEALAEGTDAHVLVARVDEGIAVMRMHPKPPTIELAPNEASLLEAINNQVRIAAKGPPTVKAPKVVTGGIAKGDVERLVDTLAHRQAAAGGAGAKPPFGGRSTMAAGDDPKRGGQFKHLALASIETKTMTSSITKIRRLVFDPTPNTEALLAAKPQWSAAKVNVRFRDPNEISFAHAPEMRDAYVQVVEVSVPVQLEKGSLKTLVLDALASFKAKLSPSRAERLNDEASKIFNGSLDQNLEKALERYKNMLIDEGAESIKMRLKHEGADFIVTDAAQEVRIPGRG